MEENLKFQSLEAMDALYGYAMILTRDSSSASDLVQKTYLQALPAVRRLRKGSNLRGWLFTILRDNWIDRLRRQRTARWHLKPDTENSEQVAIDSSNPDTQYTVWVDAERVRAAIQQLPLEDGEIIFLKEFGELSHREIAKLLRCPSGAVVSRLSCARSRLRNLLATSDLRLTPAGENNGSVPD
jgi:RNA polymerase sigma-70 factor (ECF subfamily)